MIKIWKSLAQFFQVSIHASMPSLITDYTEKFNTLVPIVLDIDANTHSVSFIFRSFLWQPRHTFYCLTAFKFSLGKIK